MTDPRIAKLDREIAQYVRVIDNRRDRAADCIDHEAHLQLLYVQRAALVDNDATAWADALAMVDAQPPPLPPDGYAYAVHDATELREFDYGVAERRVSELLSQNSTRGFLRRRLMKYLSDREETLTGRTPGPSEQYLYADVVPGEVELARTYEQGGIGFFR